jgi:hypothetical protein
MRSLKASGSLGEVDNRALCAMRLVKCPQFKGGAENSRPIGAVSTTHSRRSESNAAKSGAMRMTTSTS